MNQNRDGDTQREGFPASEGTPAPNLGNSETRRMDVPGQSPMPYNANQPQYAPQPQPQWAQPSQPGYNYPAVPPPQQVQYTQYRPALTGLGNSPFASYEANPPIREAGTAMVIEIIGGLCMFLGLGHILAGRVIPGLVLLVGYWALAGVIFGALGFLGFLTFGLAWCMIPFLWIGIPVASGIWLRNETKRRWFGRS